VAETGGMPAFSGKLTAEEIDMVVTYEREVLGGAAAGE
jgi:mono/diheme cytochrome c family protein